MSVPVSNEIPPLAKYKYDKPLNSFEQGKNKTTAIVWSQSKKDQRKKLWVGKNVAKNYKLTHATCDVFFGQLATRIFTKLDAPKTKFNQQQQGIVSRIIGDGKIETMNFARYIRQDNAFITPVAVESLAQALCFKIIIGDRDIALRNLVVQYTSSVDSKQVIPRRKPDSPALRAVKIYGIDHEYGLISPTKTIFNIQEILPKLADDPKVLADILVRDPYHWNIYDSSESDTLTNPDIEDYQNFLVKWLATGLDTNTVLNFLSDTAAAIAADDFAILSQIKQEIIDQVNVPNSVYSASEIDEKILPMVDSLIDKLQDQVQAIQEYCPELPRQKAKLTP